MPNDDLIALACDKCDRMWSISGLPKEGIPELYPSLHPNYFGAVCQCGNTALYKGAWSEFVWR